ncbi:Protein of unknown function [Streptomyces sp. DvalAA-14]|uniref:DUF4232 domain-containing protein n=1 Tax=unclassified Streptomyces TaxID=2593676 RepID=UPI00081B05C6|nr:MULTISPECIES: DUF4232 domain-containing protein [unclassified Streptomyces]MYS20085.1 DUF4232 domain-containing protein [Streptomyces sp. SID4948]SCD60573.1 Protein of unknown function [Streptomyces sp. DvalAA-14]
MRRTTRAAAVGAAAAALLLSGTAVASATIGKASPGSVSANASTSKASSAAARPCGVDDIAFYFGGFSEGTGHRSFDLTLLAHDGITCTLKDTPLVTVAGPPDQTKPIPLTVNGRGGTLVLRPDSPLHATVQYSIPDLPDDKLQVSSLTLAMPDHTSRSTYFGVPGPVDIYDGGISITSWTTGIGLGEGEEAF